MWKAVALVAVMTCAAACGGDDSAGSDGGASGLHEIGTCGSAWQAARPAPTECEAACEDGPIVGSGAACATAGSDEHGTPFAGCTGTFDADGTTGCCHIDQMGDGTKYAEFIPCTAQ